MTEAEIKAAAKKAMTKATLAKAIENVENGTDAAVKVGTWVRTLATEEAKAGGTFTGALDLKPQAATWGSLGRESFGSLYGLDVEPVAPEAAPAGSQWVRELLTQAESLPEWKELQERAAGDAWAAGVAAAGAMEAIAPLAKDLPEQDAAELQDDVEAMEEAIEAQKAAGGKVGRRAVKRLEKAKAALQDAVDADQAAAQALRGRAASVRSAIRGAAAKAAAEIDGVREAEAGLGLGPGTGSLPSMKVTGAGAEARKALRENEKLREIAKLAGRFRRRAVQKQSEKARGGRSEVCDVTLSGDIARLLPSEAVLAGDEDSEVLLFRKLLEQSALTYELRAPETKVEGPIVVLVDESGSMHGDKDTWAKAACLALLEIAARQNRAFAIVHFDDEVTRVDDFKAPRAIPFAAIEDAMTYFSGGGTSTARAINAGVDKILAQPAFKRADLVVITDGEDDAAVMIQAINAAKKKSISTHWVQIGGDDIDDELRLAVATSAEISVGAIQSEDVTGIDAALGAV